MVVRYTSKRSAVLNAEKSLINLRDEDCKLFVRVDGFKLVGIVSKIKKEYDSQMGKDRRWAIGITLDGDTFEEPLDRKNRRKGGLESVVQRETPFMIITARNTEDATDDDENFTWLPHKFSMNRMKAIEDEMNAQMRIINHLTEDYEAQQKRMKKINFSLELAQDENKNYEETVFDISQRNSRLERENQELYTLLQRLRGHGLEVEGELAVELKRAMDKGREKAMTPHEVRMNKLHEDEEEKQMVLRTLPKENKIDTDAIKDIIQSEFQKYKISESQTAPPKKSGGGEK